jgi:uncharacterized protein (TIGR02001 family)
MLESSRNTGTVSRLGFLRTVLACACLPAGWAPWPACALGSADSFSLGGSLSLTSDYIYRGLSESDGHLVTPQVDLHLSDASGDFAGVWASTRDTHIDPYARYDLELYLGHRFNLGADWGLSLAGRSHYYLGGEQEMSADYQEMAASVSYSDRWSLSLTAIPNAVRYWYDYRLSRAPAYVADTSLQWLVGAGCYMVGGAGYYYASGTGPGVNEGAGYAYGNAGLAYLAGPWRLDLGFFLTQARARAVFPYPLANQKVAGTVSWHF